MKNSILVWLMYRDQDQEVLQKIALPLHSHELQVGEHWISYHIDKSQNVEMVHHSENMREVRLYQEGHMFFRSFKKIGSSYVPRFLVAMLLLGFLVLKVFYQQIKLIQQQSVHNDRTVDGNLSLDDFSQVYAFSFPLQEENIVVQDVHVPETPKPLSVDGKEENFGKSYQTFLAGNFDQGVQNFEKDMSMYSRPQKILAKTLVSQVYLEKCQKSYARKDWEHAFKYCEKACQDPSTRSKATLLLGQMDVQLEKIFYRAYMMEDVQPNESKQMYQQLVLLVPSQNSWRSKAQKRLERL
ncbi:MAG: hypothetical protein R3A11_05050 [Bdellovibrionota bacterium]